MGYTAINDNIYKEGESIRAKASPAVQLTIASYYRRIYYCAVVGQPEHKHFAYFENELIAPGANVSGNH